MFISKAINKEARTKTKILLIPDGADLRECIPCVKSQFLALFPKLISLTYIGELSGCHVKLNNWNHLKHLSGIKGLHHLYLPNECSFYHPNGHDYKITLLETFVNMCLNPHPSAETITMEKDKIITTFKPHLGKHWARQDVRMVYSLHDKAFYDGLFNLSFSATEIESEEYHHLRTFEGTLTKDEKIDERARFRKLISDNHSEYRSILSNLPIIYIDNFFLSFVLDNVDMKELEKFKDIEGLMIIDTHNEEIDIFESLTGTITRNKKKSGFLRKIKHYKILSYNEGIFLNANEESLEGALLLAEALKSVFNGPALHILTFPLVQQDKLTVIMPNANIH